MAENLLKKEKTLKFSVYSILSLQEVSIIILNTSNIINKVILTFYYTLKWKNKQINQITSSSSSSLSSLSSSLSSLRSLNNNSENNNEEKDKYYSSINLPNKPKRDIINEINNNEENQKNEENNINNNNKINNKINKNQLTTMIHGIAHAESYAIELFWDCIARYCYYNLPLEFYDDMVTIAEQEATHFLLWYNRLIELNCPYGSLWSHDGLWKSAEETQYSILDRFAVVNLLHEARGLDTYPISLKKFQSQNDMESIKILNNNYQEEIFHVATALKWFQYVCHQELLNNLSNSSHLTNSNIDLKAYCIGKFHEIVKKYYQGAIKGPFNEQARELAGMSREWYIPLSLIDSE